MSAKEPGASGPAAVTEETVRGIARTVGLHLPEERIAAVTVRLREMHELAAVLDEVDLEGYELAATFDPSWTPEVQS